jgi:transcriptional regulator with XRE-family HTH domain
VSAANAVGERIRALRAARAMTRGDLAERSGVDGA